LLLCVSEFLPKVLIYTTHIKKAIAKLYSFTLRSKKTTNIIGQKFRLTPEQTKQPLVSSVAKLAVIECFQNSIVVKFGEENSIISAARVKETSHENFQLRLSTVRVVASGGPVVPPH